MGLEQTIHNILCQEGVVISRRRLNSFYKEYNNFSGPLSQRLHKIIQDPQPFVAFVREKIKKEHNPSQYLLQSLCHNNKRILRTIRLLKS